MGAQLQRRLARIEERRRSAGADQRSDPPADIWERFVARHKIRMRDYIERFAGPEYLRLEESYILEYFPDYDAKAHRQELRAARRLLKDDTPEQEAADLEALIQWAAANPLHPNVDMVPTPERQAMGRGALEAIDKALKECKEAT